MRKYFGTDGIRGKVNIPPMTPDIALKLGQILGNMFTADGKRHTIVIGKDTRLSGYVFEASLVAGLCSQGVDVVLVGSIPTPAIAFMTKSIRASAGIVISASHNPYHDNGIKIFDQDGYKLPDEVELQIEDMLDNAKIEGSVATGRAFRIETAMGRYVEYVKATFDKKLDLRGLKIVVDCANGACYKVAPMALEELGAELVVLNDDPNGVNINYKCGATAPEAMVVAVLDNDADLGISLDGDGDRVIMCDHKGSIVDGDMIMGICALLLKDKGVLAHNTIVGTVMTNQGFINSMKGHGINVVRSQVGDRYVIEEMLKNGYKLGGEQSGHVIFIDHATTGDGLVAAFQVLKVMRRRNAKLAELTSFIELYPQTLINVDVASKPPLSGLKRTNKLIATIEAELGDKGRVLVRYSGTENKLRVMIEGEDEAKVRVYANNIASVAKEEILKAN